VAANRVGPGGLFGTGAGPIRSFKARYPGVGPAIWIATLEYFIVQPIAAAVFSPTYDWANNEISDLGATYACGTHSFCSPRHELMNIGFIILGVVMAAGAVLTHTEFRNRHHAWLGFVFMGIAGIGGAVVGFSPENVNNTVHVAGAFCAIGAGNVALLIFAGRLEELPRWLKVATVIAGAVGLIGCLLFAVWRDLIGKGTTERIAAYPETIWLLAFGAYASASHYRERRRRISGAA
jgi:hypothetical membrane protein